MNGKKFIAVKAPGFGDRRKAMLEDLAILLGTAVMNDTGIKLEDPQPKGGDTPHLGFARKIEVSKDMTKITDGAGSADDLFKRVLQIEAEMMQSTSEYDKEKLQERIVKLEGGSGVIYVGAHSEPEMKEIKARVEDALNSVRAALPRTAHQDATEDEKKKKHVVVSSRVVVWHCFVVSVHWIHCCKRTWKRTSKQVFVLYAMRFKSRFVQLLAMLVWMHLLY